MCSSAPTSSFKSLLIGCCSISQPLGFFRCTFSKAITQGSLSEETEKLSSDIWSNWDTQPKLLPNTQTIEPRRWEVGGGAVEVGGGGGRCKHILSAHLTVVSWQEVVYFSVVKSLKYLVGNGALFWHLGVTSKYIMDC